MTGSFPYETRILLAEDTEITRKIVHRMLYKLGYTNVVEVEDGAQAWTELEKGLASKRRFDLIITDWKMPLLTGLELLKKVRNNVFLARLPIIVLTTNTKKEQVMEALSAGATNYVAKPFVIEMLEKKLQETYRTLGTEIPSMPKRKGLVRRR